MGARQRGRRGQQAKAGNSKNSTPVSQKKSSSSLPGQSLDPAFRAQALQGWQNYSNRPSPPHQNGFSLSQEARNTETHIQGWPYSTPLRGKAISFVSAGNLRMEDEPAQETHTSDVPEEGQPAAISDSFPAAEDAAAKEQTPVETMPPEECLPREVTAPQTQQFRDRAASSSTESSSEEILFLGRQSATPRRSPIRNPRLTARPMQPPMQEVKKLLLPSPTPATAQPPDPMPASQSNFSVPQMPNQQRINSRLRRRGIRGTSQQELAEEEAIMQDYIDNLAMNDDSEEETEPAQPHSHHNEQDRFYDGTVDQNVKAQTLEVPGVDQLPEITQAIDWSCGDLEDFDDFTTTDEEVTEITQVLRRRKRTTGLQYLVSAVGKNASDAKWVPYEKLTSSTAREEIRVFEEIRQIELQALEGDQEESSTNSEDEDALDDLIDEINSEDDENARIMSQTARMTDEQIAQALAKQEELGMGGDELLLFDGHVSGEEDDELGRGDDFIPFSMTTHTSNRTRSKINKRASDRFPSAAAFADALDEDPYGGFDVMDFDRPSLKPKRNGRKGALPPELQLSDEDLAETIRSTWHKDREKKAARKQERAETRSLAALNSAIGSDPDVIKNAIRTFLVQGNESLSLPVMEAPIRASVHRLAKVLNLNSRSEGKGDSRHPILTKTPRTVYYTIDTIWEIDALINQRRFFPRNPDSYKSHKLPRGATSGARVRRAGGGAGNYSGASYMDGDVVGASAPEIGSDNKGRAMLEKMGWSSGMGIGAIGNKGGTDVIKHVVKNTKAGLG